MDYTRAADLKMDTIGTMPEWNKVTSSIIDRISWTDEGNLYVRFLNGSLYLYHNVPAEVYQNFLNAKSKGNFLHSEIKGKYEYSRLY